MDTPLTVQPLKIEHAGDATAYLEARPILSAYARGLIRDHGIEDTPKNRGDFYACRAHDGGIRGVALMGDAILFEADDETAIDSLAAFARGQFSTRLIRGERNSIERFWQTYSEGECPSHTTVNEHLLAMCPPIEIAAGDAPCLRAATREDLPLLVEVNVGMFCAEGGRNPLEHDPDGFYRRLTQRIERGRVWVWREGDRLLFKTDVLADTPQAVYVEGVYVAPECRGRGVGLRCLSAIGCALLRRSAAVCLTVRVDNDPARSLYRQAGFQFHSEHATIYLRQTHRRAVASDIGNSVRA